MSGCDYVTHRNLTSMVFYTRKIWLRTLAKVDDIVLNVDIATIVAMPRNTWSNWTQSAPVLRSLKQRRGENGVQEGLYVDITCPHCGDVIEALAASVAKNKSNICRSHLASKKCNLSEDQRGGMDATILSLPPSRQAERTEVLHRNCVSQEQLRASEARGEQRLRESEARGEQRLQNVVQHVVSVMPYIPWTYPVVPEELGVQIQRSITTSNGAASTLSLPSASTSTSAPTAMMVCAPPTSSINREAQLEAELERARNKIHTLGVRLRATEDDREAQVATLKKMLRNADSESKRERAKLRAGVMNEKLQQANCIVKSFAEEMVNERNQFARKAGVPDVTMDSLYARLRRLEMGGSSSPV